MSTATTFASLPSLFELEPSTAAGPSTLLRALGTATTPDLPPAAPTERGSGTPASLRGADRPVIPLPELLGGYRIGRILARGGMSVVVEAVDPSGQPVALKVMRPVADGRHIEQDAWDREVSILSALRHPGLVPLLDSGTGEGGELFLAMPLLDGEAAGRTIVSMRERDPPELRAATRERMIPAFLEVCSTLQYAHDCGVLHCDLKPSNIFLPRTGRRGLLLDWGVSVIGAHWTPGERGVGARPGGTPGYMSPEQIGHRVTDLDVRSDVYGLGALLYEFCTWRPAFRKGSPRRVMADAVHGRLIAPGARAPELGIPERLSEVILAALEVERRNRPSSVAALGEAVREAIYD